MGRTLLSAAFEVKTLPVTKARILLGEWSKVKGKVKGGGQECPPHTTYLLE